MMSFGNIREGMNVCDMNGDKVGSIKTIHRLGRAVGRGDVTPTGEDGYLHVETGFLGLGKDLYIPFSNVRDCTADCCFLNLTKDRIDSMGWDQKPPTL